MNQTPVYIDGWSNLSAQATFEPNHDRPTVAVADGVFFRAQEPDYKTLLPRRQLRRWDRVVRMGLATALQALERAGQPAVDAILSSTAWGCVRATEEFLEALVANGERYMAPTAFVQSTHNTVAAQIGRLLSNTGYNMTYTQGVASFDLALWDAIDLLQDAQHVLICNTEELTPLLKGLLERLACATPARPMGEGAACFVLSQIPNSHSIARLVGLELGFRLDRAMRHRTITALLQKAGYEITDLDLLLAPHPPNSSEQLLFQSVPWYAYETWGGHYPTQSAFGLGIAVAALDGENVAQHLLGADPNLNRIGLYQQQEDYWSFLMLDRRGLKNK